MFFFQELHCTLPGNWYHHFTHCTDIVQATLHIIIYKLFFMIFQVVIVGNGAVGKSSLIQRYCRGTFTKGYKKTIGVDFLEKHLRYVQLLFITLGIFWRRLGILIYLHYIQVIFFYLFLDYFEVTFAERLSRVILWNYTVIFEPTKTWLNIAIKTHFSWRKLSNWNLEYYRLEAAFGFRFSQRFFRSIYFS